MALYHYSPKDVSINIAGVFDIQGFVDGTFINLTRDVKPFDSVRAMDGEVARVYRKDESYMLELTLAQSSPSNNILSTIYNIDVATQVGKFPIIIKDNRGSTTFFSLTAWIEDIPQVSFGNDIQPRVWKLRCTQSALYIGGNAPESDIEALIGQAASILPVLSEFGLI